MPAGCPHGAARRTALMCLLPPWAQDLPVAARTLASIFQEESLAAHNLPNPSKNGCTICMFVT